MKTTNETPLFNKPSLSNINEKSQIIRQAQSFYQNEILVDSILNANPIKLKDLLKTIKTQNNKLHKNFISNSSSIDEGVESDFSSPTQSFSNDFLSSISANTQLFYKQQQQQHNQQQHQPSASTLVSMSSSPPLTPPLQARKTRTQASNRSIGSIGNKNKYVLNNNNNNSSSGSINIKKSSYNPLDLSQIKRELTKLIKINSGDIASINNSNTNIQSNQKKQQESHKKNLSSMMNDKLIENNKTSDHDNSVNSCEQLKSSKSWDNLVENASFYNKFNRKCSLN